MVVQRSKTSKTRRHRRMDEQMPLSTTSLVEKTLAENLDEETRMAKRHLTKEMWQLVSIAVKRMADELVTISNNQQQQQPTVGPSIISSESATMNECRHLPSPTPMGTTDGSMPTSISKLPSATTVTELGAGDISGSNKSKGPVVTKTIRKKQTMPMHMLECSSKNKKKETSNNAVNRPKKSAKKPKKSMKKVIQRSPSFVQKHK